VAWACGRTLLQNPMCMALQQCYASCMVVASLPASWHCSGMVQTALQLSLAIGVEVMGGMLQIGFTYQAYLTEADPHNHREGALCLTSPWYGMQPYCYCYCYMVQDLA